MSVFDSLKSQQPAQMNLMQQLQELKQHPASFLQKAGYNIPDGMVDPTQITQHLLTSGQIPQSRYAQLMQKFGRK